MTIEEWAALLYAAARGETGRSIGSHLIDCIREKAEEILEEYSRCTPEPMWRKLDEICGGPSPEGTDPA